MEETANILFKTITKIEPLGSPLISMYSADDSFARPIFLRFYFKHREQDDAIYMRLKEVVESFEGEQAWTLIRPEKSKSYFITPVCFSSLIGSDINKRDSDFNDNIIKTINDIPLLTEWIVNNKAEWHKN